MQYRLSNLRAGLSPMQIRRLLKKAGVADAYQAGDIEVLPGAALVVWTASMLGDRSPITADGRELLLDLLAVRIAEAGTLIDRAFTEARRTGEQSVPAIVLTILDGTLIGMTGMDHWLDLRDGERRAVMPQAPMEAVSYNLTTLYAVRLTQHEVAARKETERAGKCRTNSQRSTGG